MSVAGFDVGSDTSVVGLARRKGIDVVLNAESGRLTPSMVAFSPKQRFLGCLAGHNIATNPVNTVNKIKRILGKKFNDPELQEEIKDALFKVTEGPDGFPLINVNYLGEARTFSTEQIMAMLLGELKGIAEKDQGAKITDCVISCPVFFTDAQRRALLDASQIAGLNALRLIPETTATALSYGIYKTDLPEKDPIHVAFVDIGESSLQCAVVSFKKGQLKVLAHGYDRNFGGRNLDSILVAHFAAEFKEKRKIDIYEKPRSLLRMRVAVEKLKKVLSANAEATISVECLADDYDFSSKMTREKLEEMAAEALGRVKTPLELCLKESGLAQSDLSAVEVVGNASRIPAVIKTIESVFGQEIRRTLNASESVARGCALQGAMLSPAFKVREFEVQDAYPFPLSFTWKKADEAGKPTDEDVTEVIFPKNTTSVPSTKVLTLMRSEGFGMECACAEPELLPPGIPPTISTFQIGPVPKTKDGSVPKLKVTLKLNLHGVAAVDSVQAIEEQIVEKPPAPAKEEEAAEGAEAMDTDKKEDAPKEEPKVEKKKIRTDVPVKATTNGLNATVLQQYVEKEFDMAMTDRVMEETKERKNAVEEYVYNMRNKLCGELADYVAEEAKAAFVTTLEDTENWLYEDGEDETKGVYIAKLEELQKTGEPIVQRAVEEGTRSGAAQVLDTVCGVLLAQCADDKFAHIDEAERAKVVKECTDAKAWLADKMGQQNALPKTAPLVVLTKEIENKKDMIERVCKPVMSKPKPAPPKEEPKPEAKEGEGEPMDADVSKEGDAEFVDAEPEPAPMQADLD
uniref:Heat shock protein 70 n=1 Tax=Pyramimonas obovata TaxID=1411642 RepID=A0A7S0WU64_9CHLO|mmetsp:Transcript_42/g.100  ORF Transcript_42/g.100 Transcript_42/m.100 type:complete len:800 (+) Transcript_42:131-2530(+)|eukprot:CAMPEP_0118932612 /NCGR_PEP_ID=MMETSP1169-20130426/10526_1 /TAXON_ID=36882 /ORGANISM="Pyramimonas obovata, Strain CCMP722" /LENGTH=799 /DNA_ID=CAMNT_0006875299 /DNA_START=112 /DNA_END=2511 /DNA_ORIENTATION=-